MGKRKGRSILSPLGNSGGRRRSRGCCACASNQCRTGGGGSASSFRGGRRGAATTAAAAAAERGHDAGQEAGVGEELAHVPHHDAAEARVLLGGGDDAAEGRGVDVAAAGARVGRHADEHAHVGVLARLVRPRVPDVEVPRVGVVEVDHAAVVVVELDVDPVERDGPVQHVVHRRVRVHALRRR